MTTDDVEDGTQGPQDELTQRIVWSLVLVSIVGAAFCVNALEIVISAFCLIAEVEWINIFELMQKRHGTSEAFNFFGTMLLTMTWISAVNLYKVDPRFFFECLVLVWVSDISSYSFGGNNLNGTKLWPTISPNKTLGGSIASLLCCSFLGLFLNHGLYLSIFISTIAQGGDILESFVKRLAGLKNSNLAYLKIPGHGGVLDRIDGIILAVPVSYLVKISLK